MPPDFIPELFIATYCILALWASLVVLRDFVRGPVRARTFAWALLAYFFGVVALAAL